MKTIKIADLKAHLSAYLKEVRAGGELIVADRDTPVALLSPMPRRRGGFTVIPAKHPSSDLKRFRGIRPAKDFDPLDALLEERGERDLLP